MTQAGRTVIDQQEGTEAGASGDDLGAPFSLLALSKSALTHQSASGRWYCLTAAVCPPGAAPPGCPPLLVYTGALLAANVSVYKES